MRDALIVLGASLFVMVVNPVVGVKNFRGWLFGPSPLF
jgi:hypothetical protein